MSESPRLSIVIPVKNEETNVAALAAEIGRAFATATFAWEVMWVDDGSTDATRSLLKTLPAPHRWIALDKNHGQSAAFMAGFRQARGEWIGTLDGDGQNDPADLLRQLAEAERTGADMVNGIRARRKDNLVRKLSSKIGNGVRVWLTGNSCTDVGCSTRVCRKAVLIDLPFFHGMHRFLPALALRQGAKLAEIPVNHRPRGGGVSKYGVLNRAFNGLRDAFGVRWLIARARIWRVAESGP